MTMPTEGQLRHLSSYERSLRDLNEGRVYKYDSLEGLVEKREVRSEQSQSQSLSSKKGTIHIGFFLL